MLDVISLILYLGMGIFWALTYILMIKIGQKDNETSIPLLAFNLNISWEIIFTFIYVVSPIHRMISMIWLLLDILISMQFFRFGKKIFGFNMNESKFRFFFIIIQIVSFITLLNFIQRFDDFNGLYSAFASNLIMSISFIIMLNNRKNSKGQSIYIAIFKLIGTLCASLRVIYHQMEFNLLVFTGILIFLIDSYYCIGLYLIQKKEKISPFTKI